MSDLRPNPRDRTYLRNRARRKRNRTARRIADLEDQAGRTPRANRVDLAPFRRPLMASLDTLATAMADLSAAVSASVRAI